MKARLVRVVGTRVSLRRYWGDDCPSCLGSRTPGYHDATTPLAESDDPEEDSLGGRVEDHPEGSWPTACDHCGSPVPSDAKRQVSRRRRYDTISGKPEPGDVFWADWVHWVHEGVGRCIDWDDCSDPRGHLMAILPDGTTWDSGARASNCTLPGDRNHRCWVLHGEAPDLTVDKRGRTCAAGAGSIVGTHGYHGFLVAGSWR